MDKSFGKIKHIVRKENGYGTMIGIELNEEGKKQLEKMGLLEETIDDPYSIFTFITNIE